MRWFTLSMLVFAMSVLGCKSSPWNKSQGGGAGPNSPPPTNGKFWEDQPNSSPSTNNIPATNLKLGTPSPNAAELDGVFAGRVVDNFDRPVPNTFLRVSLVDPKNPNAPPKGVGVSTNPEGYFFIQGLNAGQTYTLAAQSKDGDRPLGGVAQARPPNTRLLIRISENNFSSVVGDPGPAPGANNPFSPPPAAPQNKEQPQREQLPSTTPAQPMTPAQPNLNLPNMAPEPDPIDGNPPPGSSASSNMRNGFQRNSDGGGWSPGGPQRTLTLPVESENPSATPVVPTRSLENVTTIPNRNRDPNLSIPNPLSPPPRAPIPAPMNQSIPHESPYPNDSMQYQPIPPRAAPPPNRVIPTSASVPERVEPSPTQLNFRVYDPQGQPWEFRDNSGRYVLIDFWATNCIPCIKSMPEIKRLASEYGGSGLEVIGIALDGGPWSNKAQNVADLQRTKRLNYRVFLEAERDAGQMRKMFRFQLVPTLILLDHQGNEIWRGTGAGEIPQLEAVLRSRLRNAR